MITLPKTKTNPKYIKKLHIEERDIMKDFNQKDEVFQLVKDALVSSHDEVILQLETILTDNVKYRTKLYELDTHMQQCRLTYNNRKFIKLPNDKLDFDAIKRFNCININQKLAKKEIQIENKIENVYESLFYSYQWLTKEQTLMLQEDKKLLQNRAVQVVDKINRHYFPELML